jgi:hypothetical protein
MLQLESFIILVIIIIWRAQDAASRARRSTGQLKL